MKSLFKLGKRFVAEEKAAEVTELGVVLAFIVILSIAFIKGVGNAVSNFYNTRERQHLATLLGTLHKLARGVPLRRFGESDAAKPRGVPSKAWGIVL